MTVRTRFAPSPTGYLHIGGVRTALFNWLFAKKHGGQFILRIDDTDQQRNVDEALLPILNGFRWLGMNWDEGPTPDGKGSFGPHGPYFQSQRSEHYQKAVDQLLASGHAYRDFATTEEVAAERTAAEQEKRPFVYSRRWMAETADAAARFIAEGRQSVVRLKMPREGYCEFFDHIRGHMKIEWASEQDHVIQRADGSFIYHLASVVDDRDMEISHIIRAAEHLSNTPRQIFIAQSLGMKLPEFAHLPVVNEPGGSAKLSKRKLDKYFKNAEFKKLYDHAFEVASVIDRDLQEFAHSQGTWVDEDDRKRVAEKLRNRMPVNIPTMSQDPVVQAELVQLLRDRTLDIFQHPAFVKLYNEGHQIIYQLGLKRDPSLFNPVVVDFYRDVGYLPDAIINYLVLLGWSLDDKTEDLTRDEMIKHFTLERVNKSPASFDPAKLWSVQDRYMQRLDLKKKVALCVPFLQKAGWVSDPPPCDLAPKLSRILTGAGDRIKVAGDILDYPEFFVPDDQLPYDAAAVEKRIKNGNGAELLAQLKDRLAAVEPFDAAQTEAAVKQFVTDAGIKIGDIIHPLRLAVTGKTVGIGMFDSLEIVGREGCLRRIERTITES